MVLLASRRDAGPEPARAHSEQHYQRLEAYVARALAGRA